MEFGGRKRGRPEATVNGNGGTKRSKRELESSSSGLGSKMKPCTKFFSTSGCPFGESCHFLHYVPGAFKTVSQMQNLGGNPPLPNLPPPRNNYSTGSSAFPDSPSPTVKNRLCKKFNSAEGCKFGDKCHFAHGEWELGKPSIPSYEDTRPHHYEHPRPPHPQQGPPPSSFGASATAKISVDAKLAGSIIGKNGVNSKQVSRLTGVKLSIRDHDGDPNLRNIELEGSFEQIQQASAMVRELIGNASSSYGSVGKRQQGRHNPGSNFKKKLCDNFTKGKCTFGDRCHFAHGAHELNTSGA